ncbi:MAG: hypothetical protein QGG14_00840 [Planctomycetota bacterium]|jgi:hypothetical protein|nr:hypothetical protein [Planctomycetota bacterium]
MPDIRFDQSAVLGTVNESRDDIVPAAVVTVNALSVAGTAIFGLLDRPLGSAAALSGAGSTRSITPDLAGTYRVRVIDDADGSYVIHTFTVLSTLVPTTSTSLALHFPAHNERASAQANEVDPDPGDWVNASETNKGGSNKGWHPSDERNLRRLAAFMKIDRPIRGLHLANDGVAPNTILNIASGECVNAFADYAMVSGVQRDPDISAAGAGGLFSGVVAADTWYAVFLIANSATGAVDSGFDTDEGAANRPAAFDKHRRLGWVRTDGSGFIRPFFMPAHEGRSRWVCWQTEALVQSAGTATTYTDTTTSAATVVAPTAKRQQVSIESRKIGGSSNTSRSVVVPDGWNEAAGNVEWGANSGFSGGGDPVTNNTVEMPVGPLRLLRYHVDPPGDAGATVRVNGWEDSI